MNDPVSNTGNNISKRTFSRASRHAELQKFLYIQKGESILRKMGSVNGKPLIFNLCEIVNFVPKVYLEYTESV